MSDLNEKNNKLVDEILKELQFASDKKPYGKEKNNTVGNIDNAASDVEYILNEIGFQSDSAELWDDPYLTPGEEKGQNATSQKTTYHSDPAPESKKSGSDKNGAFFGDDGIFASLFGKADKHKTEDVKAASFADKNETEPENDFVEKAQTKPEEKSAESDYRPSFTADDVKINYGDEENRDYADGEFVSYEKEENEKSEKDENVDFMRLFQNNTLRADDFKPKTEPKSVYGDIMAQRETKKENLSDAADYFSKYFKNEDSKDVKEETADEKNDTALSDDTAAKDDSADDTKIFKPDSQKVESSAKEETLSEEERYMRGMAADDGQDFGQDFHDAEKDRVNEQPETVQETPIIKQSYNFKTFGGYSADELLNDNQNVSAYSKAYATDFSSAAKPENADKTEKEQPQENIADFSVPKAENKEDENQQKITAEQGEKIPEASQRPLNIFDAAAQTPVKKHSEIYGIYSHGKVVTEPEKEEQNETEQEVKEYNPYAEFARLKAETDNFKNPPPKKAFGEENGASVYGDYTEKSKDETADANDKKQSQNPYDIGLSFGAYSANGVFSGGDDGSQNEEHRAPRIFDYDNSDFETEQQNETEEKLFDSEPGAFSHMPGDLNYSGESFNDEEQPVVNGGTDIKDEEKKPEDENTAAKTQGGDTREFEPITNKTAKSAEQPENSEQENPKADFHSEEKNEEKRLETTTGEETDREEMPNEPKPVVTVQEFGVGQGSTGDTPKRARFDFDDIIAYESDYTPIMQSDVKEAFRDAAPIAEMVKAEEETEKKSDINEDDFVLPIDIKSADGTSSPEKFRSFADFKLTGGIERSEFEKFFSTGVMLDDEEIEKRKSTRKKRAKRKTEDTTTVTNDFIISREEISDDDEIEEDNYQPPRTDDYNTHGDADSVMKNIKRLGAWYTARTVLLLILGAAISYIWFVPDNGVFVTYFAAFAATTVLLLLAMLLSMEVIAHGIGGIFAKPTADTLPALASAGAMAQALIYMFQSDAYYTSPVTVFAPVALLCLVLNSLGKALNMGVIKRNFKQTVAEIDYSAAYLVKNKDLNRRMGERLAEPEPQLLVSRPTGLVKGFLRSSLSERVSDKRAKGIGIAVLLVSIVCAVVCFITTKSIPMAVTAFAAAACVGAPVSGTLVSAVPNLLMQRAANKVGAVITGWSSVEELGKANIVTATAEDLFPEEQVRLCGIKTFAKERVDLAILYAASILAEGCGTMKSVFMPVIEGNVSMLYKVENLTKETGCGVMGWIDHNRVVLGNRAMMTKHGVELPSMDYELRYTKGDKKPMYLAVSGRLFGMFLLKYTFNEQVAEMLDGLQNRGISLLVQSDDFNLSAEMIEEIYDLQSGTVKVMSAKEEEALKPCLAYTPDCDGNMAHIGTFTSFLGGLRAASSEASAEKTANAVQICGAVIGMLLVVLLTVTGGIASLNLPAVMLYMTAWLLLTVAMPLLRKY